MTVFSKCNTAQPLIFCVFPGTVTTLVGSQSLTVYVGFGSQVYVGNPTGIAVGPNSSSFGIGNYDGRLQIVNINGEALVGLLIQYLVNI